MKKEIKKQTTTDYMKSILKRAMEDAFGEYNKEQKEAKEQGLKSVGYISEVLDKDMNVVARFDEYMRVMAV